MVEATAAVIAPGKNNLCPNGKLFFGSGTRIAAQDLANQKDLTATVTNLADRFKTSKDLTDPHVIYDNHLVATKDGTLIYTVEGIIWRDDIAPHPARWEQTKTNILKNKNFPGGRAAIWVFASYDCGMRWAQISMIDAARLVVEDSKGNFVEGYCGVPRVDAAKKTAEAGGFDGHYLYADSFKNDLYLTTICTTGNDPDYGLLLTSPDGGKTWRVLRQVAAPPNFWRVPINSLSNGYLAFAYALNGSAQIETLKLPIKANEKAGVTPVAKLSYPSDSDTATDKMSERVGLDANMYAYLALARSSQPARAAVGARMPPPTERFMLAAYESEGKNAIYNLWEFDPQTGEKKAYDTIKAEKPDRSVLHGTFADAEGTGAPHAFFWIDQQSKNFFRLRAKFYRGTEPIGGARFISPGFATYKFTGDYIGGASYQTADSWEFFLSWSEAGKLRYKRIFVPQGATK
jgi:hypothetical protein